MATCAEEETPRIRCASPGSQIPHPVAKEATRAGHPPELKSAKGRAGAKSFRGFPALRQHIECQRVTVGILIAFQYRQRRQHMPDAIIVEDVTLAGFAHGEAIYFVFVVVGDDDFATVSPAATQ